MHRIRYLPPNCICRVFSGSFTPIFVACRWAGGGGSCGKLLTGSYDGSVRMLDPSTATFDLLVSDEDAEFSAMDCLADATSG